MAFYEQNKTATGECAPWLLRTLGVDQQAAGALRESIATWSLKDSA